MIKYGLRCKFLHGDVVVVVAPEGSRAPKLTGTVALLFTEVGGDGDLIPDANAAAGAPTIPLIVVDFVTVCAQEQKDAASVILVRR